MQQKSANYSVIRNLQIVFLISTILLLVSIFSSILSIRKLISTSESVSHTYEVLTEAEKLISAMKDAETGQRGYIITHDPTFLEPYNNAKVKTAESINKLLDYTNDNPVQQKNIPAAKVMIDMKLDQMQNVINAKLTHKNSNDTLHIYREMVKGKKIMDDLRMIVERIKNEEKRLLTLRQGEQEKYISYTPTLVISAALISILITVFSFVKIRQELDERVKKQLEEEAKYKETSNRISVMEGVTQKLSNGNYETRSDDKKDDELGRVSTALNLMASSLESNFNSLKHKNLLQEGIVKVNDAIRGERNINKLSSNLIECITEFLNAPIATIYINNNGLFSLTSSFAATNAQLQFTLGEGLIGEAAKKSGIKIVEDLPPDFLISSSIGKAMPVSLIIVPLIFEQETIAVIEIGLHRKPQPIEIEFLENIKEPIAIGINAALSYVKLQNLLEETQSQTEELQAQHNELENLNAELEAQSQKLQASEEELKVQQEELQQTNEELEERSLLLEEKNSEVVKKARELELSTRYKSEFLANMSHELRTPLNSILLLSRLLSENNEKNLSTDQVEYATVIQSSGNGLLALIDEILDLSKIEAGKMQLEYIDVPLSEFSNNMKGLFKHLAKEKGIEFDIIIEPDLPFSIETDKGRVEQILKNLLSNSIKFTSKGSVVLEIKNCPANNSFICFSVKDTGIGIPADKQQSVFDAFQQADGSTRRKFGGTGLGLSISRELAKLLGGNIHLTSEENKGSEFTLRIPTSKSSVNSYFEYETTADQESTKYVQKQLVTITNEYISSAIPKAVPDDRDSIALEDKTILIIEDDTPFAKSLLEMTRKKGYKGVVCVRGDEAYNLVKKFNPVGILLDVQLPIKSGWQIIDELKNDPQTRHIPVHMMSSYKVKKESLLKGAVDFINKPFAFEQMPEIFRKIEHVLNRTSKKVLIIEDNPKHAKALSYYLETHNINSEVKSNIDESVTALKKQDTDCVILDMGIPDAKAFSY